MTAALLWAQTARMDTILGPFIQHPDVPITDEAARAAIRAAYAEGHAAAKANPVDPDLAFDHASELWLRLPV